MSDRVNMPDLGRMRAETVSTVTQEVNEKMGNLSRKLKKSLGQERRKTQQAANGFRYLLDGRSDTLERRIKWVDREHAMNEVENLKRSAYVASVISRTEANDRGRVRIDSLRNLRASIVQWDTMTIPIQSFVYVILAAWAILVAIMIGVGVGTNNSTLLLIMLAMLPGPITGWAVYEYAACNFRAQRKLLNEALQDLVDTEQALIRDAENDQEYLAEQASPRITLGWDGDDPDTQNLLLRMMDNDDRYIRQQYLGKLGQEYLDSPRRLTEEEQELCQDQ